MSANKAIIGSLPPFWRGLGSVDILNIELLYLLDLFVSVVGLAGFEPAITWVLERFVSQAT